MDPLLGQIIMFGGNFAPRGWAFCDSQLISISSNSALFSLLGTIYGGDGRTTFALPDMRGRAPMHHGAGPGLGNRVQGEKGGAELVYLNTLQIPSHSHALNASVKIGTNDNAATTNDPNGNILASGEANIFNAGSGDMNESLDGTITNQSSSATGAGLYHNNMQPFLSINYIIALVGTFPSPS